MEAIMTTITDGRQEELIVVLAQFTGTTTYHRNFFNKRFFHTDGIQALAEKAQAFYSG